MNNLSFKKTLQYRNVQSVFPSVVLRMWNFGTRRILGDFVQLSAFIVEETEAQRGEVWGNHQVLGKLRLNLLTHGWFHVLYFLLPMKAEKKTQNIHLPSLPNPRLNNLFLKSSCNCFWITEQGQPHPITEAVWPSWQGCCCCEGWAEPN